MEIKGCKCEGFYKKEYFISLDTIQKLREELDDTEKSWKETCEIMSNQETMKGIKESLKQISEGKAIPLSKLKLTSKEESTAVKE